MLTEIVDMESHKKLWQPPVEKEVVYFVMFSCAAEYTAKKLISLIEAGTSHLEKSLETAQDGIIASGQAPVVARDLLEMRTSGRYIAEFCSRTVKSASHALSAFGASYSVKDEKPAVTVLSLQTPVWQADSPVKLSRKPDQGGTMKHHTVIVQAFYSDLGLLLDGIKNTAQIAAQHLSSRLGHDALQRGGGFLNKPYNL